MKLKTILTVLLFAISFIGFSQSNCTTLKGCERKLCELNTKLAAAKKAGNKNQTTIIYPNRNHLFQECTTGSIEEYGTIEQTISPQVLTDIATWIAKQSK